MMKYGIPTFMEYGSIEDHLKFCKEHDFGLFELAFFFPWTQSDCLNLKDLAKLKSQYGTDFSIHIGDIDPFAYSPEVRKAAYETIAYTLKVADACGAKVLNMHLNDGGYASIRGTKYYIYEHYEQQYIDNVKLFMEKVCPDLEKSGCVLCFENTKGFKSFQKDAMELLLKNDSFGLTFDIGHNYKAGGDDEKFILSHISSLRHFHIHDVTESANHIALGQGVLDIEHYLDLASSVKASAVIEVKSPDCLVQSAEYLKEKGYNK